MQAAVIREYDEVRHRRRVRELLVELQNFERALDPRMPSGEEIVDEYVPYMIDRCRECDGIILVAELGNDVGGFAVVLSRVKSDDLDDGDLEYGLISEIVVAREHRGRGIGRRLLQAAESFARERHVKWLRIGVLSDNRAADRLYESMGYEIRYVEREKTLQQQE